MKIRRFEAPDMQQAIAQIKAELGPDALVVSSRPIRQGLFREGVEVMAAAEPPPARRPKAPGSSAARAIDSSRIAQLERATEAMHLEIKSLRALLRKVKSPPKDERKLSGEVRELRALVEKLSAERQTPPPKFAGSPVLNGVALKRVPGPVSVMVGPQDAGKTTTVAKLAAKRALVEGEPARIISLDAHRKSKQTDIGAFANAMGVELTTLHDPARLGEAIGRVDPREKVFVDTPGCGPQDEALIRDIARGLTRVRNADVHMVVPAGTATEDIDEAAERFDQIGINRLLLTKIDQAEGRRSLVEAPARLSLPISYLTTGQRVPDDIEIATPERLNELSNRTLPYAEKVA